MDGEFIVVTGSLNGGFQLLYSGLAYKHLDDFLHEIIDSRFFKAPTDSRPAACLKTFSPRRGF